MKRLVIDVDNTLTLGDTSDYAKVAPNLEVIGTLRAYKELGFEIVLHTARNMRTHKSNVGRINAVTLPILTTWLEEHDVPYDEIWTGKPWCGEAGFYVDDKAIRPDEFSRMTYPEIRHLLGMSPLHTPDNEC
ncbi:MAG: capsular biosynthesis protein [Pelagimonas sp.]